MGNLVPRVLSLLRDRERTLGTRLGDGPFELQKQDSHVFRKTSTLVVRWSIYIINSVDKPNFCVSLPHRRSTTVSLETNPLYS